MAEQHCVKWWRVGVERWIGEECEAAKFNKHRCVPMFVSLVCMVIPGFLKLNAPPVAGRDRATNEANLEKQLERVTTIRTVVQ
ncbi:hypothetical protein QK292_16785 [Arthrobacter sp. AL08]|uniref:hypothetical protein n=1 Tax=Arthrobacter sp. AL05 TaxID=3042232 RepID=UPI002499E574|nr:hypothetical protein [Arthrobacter sp. AL05]MDI3243208.1 hypothetical protein [Arthrobacter sp. AL05]MDI3279218.1 hypothetical protein [Arthrobacter sp. AL08]